MLKGIMTGFDNRSSLSNRNRYTIRLKQILLNFTNYENQLTDLGVEKSLIKQKDFTILMQLGGGCFLKWDDLQGATIGVFLEIQRCLELREKKLLIYNKTPDEILQNININNMYLTNENDEKSNRKYLSTVAENISQGSYLSQSQMLDKYLNSLANPNEDFYYRVIKNVSSMIQPRIRDYHDKGTYR